MRGYMKVRRPIKFNEHSTMAVLSSWADAVLSKRTVGDVDSGQPSYDEAAWGDR